MKSIYRIENITAPVTLTKKDGTQCQKQTLTLRELGGKFEDSFAATWLNDKPCYSKIGSVIAASLRFQTRTYEGQDYQDVFLQEYVVLYNGSEVNFVQKDVPSFVP